jgi:hypothetical protein
MRFTTPLRLLGLFALTCLSTAAFAFSAPAANADAPATASPAAIHQSSSTVPAYWLVATDGGIFSFGGAPYFGSTGGKALNEPIVGMAATPDGGGYWLVASDGGVFTFGDAQFFGSTGAIHLNRPIVGMTPTPDGRGYWLVASDGGIFAFGDAKFYGSTGAMTLNKPIVGMSATTDGGGYWLVASDGGIFAYGDATFWGSTGHITLNQPIVTMIAGPTGLGYILVAADGGTFSFGTAPFYGSLGGIPLKHSIVTASATPGDTGYWFSDGTGEVSAFGQASYYGSAPSDLSHPIVGMAEAPGTGAFVGAAYPSGSYGFDVSNYNMNAPACTSGLPTGLHDIGVVQVDGGVDPGASNPDYPNPCLSAEAKWAGGGLNLYTFLDNIGPASGALCSSTATCYTTGYDAGIHAFQDAQAAGANTNVTWWLDVEGASTLWLSGASGDTADNAATVQGAIAALHNTEGIADVGIYASPAVWNQIVGNYQPSVPYWMAYYIEPTGSGPADCAAVAGFQSKYLLPTGPVEIVQYTDNVVGAGGSYNVDGDYAC